MTLTELTEKIHLQTEIRAEMLDFAAKVPMDSIKEWTELFPVRERSNDAVDALKKILGDDPHNAKMLAVQLLYAVDFYRWYAQNGISEEIYIDTLKAFSRFVGECQFITGECTFDREYWTPRQISGRLFRVGTLEFEPILREDGTRVISLHIPSDAVLTDENCVASVRDGVALVERVFPEFVGAKVTCSSWLLSQDLPELLPEQSHILAFQKHFRITDIGKPQLCYNWVFKVADGTPLEALPEQTTLQRKLKAYLLAGKEFHSAAGEWIF